MHIISEILTNARKTEKITLIASIGFNSIFFKDYVKN